MTGASKVDRCLIAARTGVAALGFLAAACGLAGPTTEGNVETATLAIGETFTPAGSAAPIRFVGVGPDSRCPTDVACVSAGNALVEFSGGSNSPTPPHWYVNTNTEPRVAAVVGYLIRLEELQPKPKAATPTDPSAYRAVISVRTVSPR